MHFFDSEFLKSVVSDSDTRHQQVTAGKFEGKLKRIILPDITIDHGEYNLKLIAQGAFSPNTVTFMIIHRMDEMGKVCGADLIGGSLIVLPLHADAEFTIPQHTIWTAINVPKKHLEKYGFEVTKTELFTLDKKTFTLFNQTYLQIEKQLSEGIESPDVLQDMILSHFIGTIESLENRLELGYSDGYMMALNVRDYIIEHIVEPLQMYKLCQLTNKSVRTIERTFKQVFNLTVREYHLSYRLSLVRQTLIHDKNTSVSNAALKYGYFHLSRFSSSYKKLFLELPSQTLRN
jgi:AraC family ethanolamine operon transcriptional activator